MDGRRRRSLDSRARIVTAMLELTREHARLPGAEQVAARAGVGLRSVFRHFQDMESLYREIGGPIEAELRAWALRPFKGETWRERVQELIVRRSTAFEGVMALRRASDVIRHTSPVLQADHATMTAVLRSILRGLIPRRAVDAPTFEALDLLLSFDTWMRLRREQRLSPAQARKALQRAVKALIGPEAA